MKQEVRMSFVRHVSQFDTHSIKMLNSEWVFAYVLPHLVNHVSGYDDLPDVPSESLFLHKIVC